MGADRSGPGPAPSGGTTRDRAGKARSLAPWRLLPPGGAPDALAAQPRRPGTERGLVPRPIFLASEERCLA